MTSVKAVQAAVEGVETPDGVSFMGELFKLPDRIAYMAFLVFAKVAKTGVNAEDMEGMSAMYDMIHACLAPADADRFDAVAVEKRASAEEIFEFVGKVMESAAVRPTVSRTDSSQRARKTSKKSRERLSLPEADFVPVTDLVH